MAGGTVQGRAAARRSRRDAGGDVTATGCRWTADFLRGSNPRADESWGFSSWRWIASRSLYHLHCVSTGWLQEAASTTVEVARATCGRPQTQPARACGW